MSRPRTIAIALVALVALALPAAAGDALRLPKSFTDTQTEALSIAPGGSIWIENPIGSVMVSGGSTKVTVQSTRTIRATTDDAIRQLRRDVKVKFEGDSSKRIVRSAGLVSSETMFASLDYVIRVPDSTNVNVISGIATIVKVAQIDGRAYVRNLRGRVELSDARGINQVDGANTDVRLTYRRPPQAGSQLGSVNGAIEIRAPKSSHFDLYAETLDGDILAGFPIKGRVTDQPGRKSITAVVNGSGGPQIRAATLRGKVYLQTFENPDALAASVLPQAAEAPVREDLGDYYRDVVRTMLIEPPSARTYFVRRARFPGNFEGVFSAGANVFVGQIDGDARLTASGGEIVLGKVGGACSIQSQGGPVNLGMVSGEIHARTLAGDVYVRAARKGGTISTGGGSIVVLYSGGAISLDSGGGDVGIRQARGPVTASTKSGDIRITLDPKRGQDLVDLRTLRGNVVLELAREARADVDVIIMTDPDSAHRIESDFAGLTIVRDRVGNRMRIHATGKLNGGGAPVKLQASDGNVEIRRIPGTRLFLAEP